MKRHAILAFAAALGATLFASRGAGQTNYTRLLDFITSAGEQAPEGVVAGPNGALYGITAGYYNSYGSVFELSAATGKWTETFLHSFAGQTGDGSNFWSHATPVVGADGSIYGTTTGGGTYDGGIVFQLQPPSVAGGTWTETILYNFMESGGFSNVVFGADGKLYGATSGGGSYGQGTVFELTPPASGSGEWTERALYSFTGGSDGAYPAGLAIGSGGVIYGTTGGGGGVGEGTVFELTPPTPPDKSWTETVLYSFIGGEAGGGPFGPPVINSDGSLYGTTGSTVFQLTPPATPGAAWTQTILHSFWGERYGGPDSTLVVRNGTIYGTVSPLVCICYCYGGAVFELKQEASGAWTETYLHHLRGNLEPFGSVVMGSDGNLYGTTFWGPGGGDGILYKIDPTIAASEASDEDDSSDSSNGICNGGWRFLTPGRQR